MSDRAPNGGERKVTSAIYTVIVHGDGAQHEESHHVFQLPGAQEARLIISEVTQSAWWKH